MSDADQSRLPWRLAGLPIVRAVGYEDRNSHYNEHATGKVSPLCHTHLICFRWPGNSFDSTPYTAHQPTYCNLLQPIHRLAGQPTGITPQQLINHNSPMLSSSDFHSSAEDKIE